MTGLGFFTIWYYPRFDKINQLGSGLPKNLRCPLWVLFQVLGSGVYKKQEFGCSGGGN